ncbi:putative endonuclease precursor [Escherichia coli]|nr:putative endonuclease precursor [Escherichia coli]
MTVSYSHKDRYGRIIGHVFTTNGTDASRFMVQSGAAWVYERYNEDESLPALQREAQNKNAVCGPMQIRFHRGNGDTNITN